ncbi:MAG: M18 family aminopeptidase [Lachnospiraceae bacterium]|nr:M18 family aminopeptidase [Lachnospiraceae bacterium]
MSIKKKDPDRFDPEVINRELLQFLDESPVSFYAVKNMAAELEKAGAGRLTETGRWQLEAGKMYYVTRNDSSLIAFRVPAGSFSDSAAPVSGNAAGAKDAACADGKDTPAGFQIVASHCDSPAFKIKSNAEITVEKRYITLNVEKYGGMLCEPWFDRPLSVAGRVMIRTKEGIETRLVCIDRDLMIIPHLAIHMNREANDGYKINVQKDMLPLLAENGSGEKAGGTGSCGAPEKDAAGRFLQLIAAEAGVQPEDILDTDLFLYNRAKGTVLGLNGEFIASGRLDDLQCAYASLRGFLAAEASCGIAVHCVYDNEEVGSGTKQGAASTFLSDVLHRINGALGGDEEDYIRRIRTSFLVSADNAHGVHPNYTEKTDPTNRPFLNGGIVIKYSANQKYTTDAVSGALFREVCRRAGVPCQTFHNRSDMLGGSTLGNISTSQVAVNSVDIGLAQLAMHSSYETAGAYDTAYLAEALKTFYSLSVEARGDGSFRLR